MDEETRNLDLMVAELGSENRMVRARNERLEQELERALDENAQFKVALATIMAVSKLYLKEDKPEEVKPTKEEALI